MKTLPTLLFLTALGWSVSVFASLAPRTWGPDPFVPLSKERIAALPREERAAWEDYWKWSETLMTELAVRPKPDRSSMTPVNTPPKGGVHSKGLPLNTASSWYGSAEVAEIADRIVASQTKPGGWAKGMDYGRTPDVAALQSAVPTFDNDATVSELRFLGRVTGSASAKGPRLDEWKDAFVRGLRYVFSAQYPNGGFPQMYPLVGGYHDGVTFNDDAMTGILELLRDVSAGNELGGALLDPALRTEAWERFKKGIRCVLATQLHDADGHPTVWCQQYDPLTLRAAAARNFEPIADASRESAGITLLLMGIKEPTAEEVGSIEGAVAWFNRTALHDLKIAKAPADVRGNVVPSPGAPPLWARFYEPGTTTPIFGDRDRTIHYVLAEVSPERVAGYSWYTSVPNKVLAEYPAWHARLGRK